MNLPLNSKLWVFQSKRPFTNNEKNNITQTIQGFLQDWNAHGNELTADFSLPHNQFIVIAVDENKAKASGCSIDKLVQLIQKIDVQFQLDLLNRMNIAYSIDEKIYIEKFNQFKEMVSSGKITKETIIFNNGVDNLKDFNLQWKLPLHKSWASKWL